MYNYIKYKKPTSLKDGCSIITRYLFDEEFYSHSLKEVILYFFGAYGYLSSEGIFQVLGCMENEKKQVLNTITKLLKSGLIFGQNPKTQDGRIRTLYSLTDRGTETYNQLCTTYGLPRGGAAPAGKQLYHNYHSGFSALSLMVSFAQEGGRGLQSRAEIVHKLSAADGGKKGQSSVCIDIEMEYGNGKQIYLEQDMGTETIKKLSEKLKAYLSAGLLRDEDIENNIIIFSFHSCLGRLSKGDVPTDRLLSLLQYGMERNCTDLPQLVKCYEREKLEGLLPGRLGAPSYEKWVDILSGTFSPHMPLTDIAKVVDEHKFDAILLTSLISYEEYNFSRARTDSLRMLFLEEYENCREKQLLHSSKLWLLLSGGCCYTLPTYTISNYGKLLFGTSLQEKAMEMAAEYWDDFPGAGKTETIGTFGSLKLRNHSITEHGLHICVEDAEYDLGAFLRTAAVLHDNEDLPSPFCLIVFAENETIEKLGSIAAFPELDEDGCIREEGLTLCFAKHSERLKVLYGMKDGKMVYVNDARDLE